MKLKYLALTASLCAAFFAACDDSGVAPKEHIAAYDTLPRFCEESDTVRLSSTGNLFYCNNGDWLEVGVIINKPKSSSSTAKPKSSDDAEIESSGEENIVESAESGKSSSSRGRDKSSNSSGTNSVSSGEGTESSNSTGYSNGSTSTLDPFFENLGAYIVWKRFTESDDGDRSATMGYARSKFSDEEFIAGIEGLGYSNVNLNKLTANSIEQLGQTIGLTTPTLNEYRYLFVKKDDSDASNVISYFVVGPTSAMATGSRTAEVGIYKGDIQELVESWPSIGCGNLWCAPDGVYRVTTGLDKGTNTSGYWFDITDNSFGGESYFTWPVPRGNEYTDDAFDPIIDHCRGICGIATLDHGELAYNAYVGLGFNIAGETSATDMTPAAADASAWDGICVVYSSTTDMTVEMSLGEDGDRDLAFDLPYAVLPRGTNMVTNLSWEDFVQAGWGKDKGAAVITGPEAAEQLVSLTFKIQATDGDYNFNLISVGKYGTCE